MKSSSSGLSTGAQAGIGVGVGVAGLLLIALAFFLLRRRYRNKLRNERAKTGPVKQVDDYTPEAKSPGQAGQGGEVLKERPTEPVEMDGNQIQEIDGGGTHQVHEVPADSTAHPSQRVQSPVELPTSTSP